MSFSPKKLLMNSWIPDEELRQRYCWITALILNSGYNKDPLENHENNWRNTVIIPYYWTNLKNLSKTHIDYIITDD